MMPRTCTDPISRTRDGDRSRLEGNVVGRGKSPIGREADDRGIGKIAGDQRSQVVEFLLAGLMTFDIALSQPLLPAHAPLASQTPSVLVAPCSAYDRGVLP